MRTFTISLIFVMIIVSMAMVQPVSADGAIALSGGVSLTQSTPPSNMGSQVDAWCGAEIVATWSSTTNKQLKLPEGLLYKAYSQFTGIRNIERIELTPDDGITLWEARQLVGKGWQVVIPLEKLLRLGSKGGSYGGYGLKWKITSHDKENRLMILFIPITWNSSRASEALNQVVVEQRPYDSSLWCKEDWALYLSLHCGFDSVIPLPDLNFEAQRQAINGFKASHPETLVEHPIEQPALRNVPLALVPIPDSFTERDDQSDPSARPRVVEPRRTVTTTPSTIILRSASREYRIQVSLEDVRTGNTLVFKRGKTTLGTAKVTGCINDDIFAAMTSGNIASFRRGDCISVEKGKGR